MKYNLSFILGLLLYCIGAKAQEFKVDTAFIVSNYPNDIIYKTDIVYKSVNGIDLKLDIYKLSRYNKEKTPVIISIHGGAWYAGTKNDDIHYSVKLFNNLLQQGYAIVTIEYRLSPVAKFPAQIQDCNDAIDFVYKKADEYNLAKDKIAVMGGSAGGHLAALIGTTNNYNIPEFYSNQKKPAFKIKAVVDFFGPTDFMAMRGNSGVVEHDDPNSAEAQLIGSSPLLRPDLAKKASPTTYVCKQTPPFIIFHGDKDTVVQYSQSVIFHSYLNLAGVNNKFITVNGAGHGGAEFGADEIINEISNFLRSCMKD
jgi:acetyl esterase/lipase